MRVSVILPLMLAMAGTAGSTPPPIVRNQPLMLPVAPTRPGQAQSTAEPAEFAGIVASHNRARRAVGVPEVAWSGELAQTAQGWANTLRASNNCDMRHSGASGIGENLAWASGQHLSPAAVVAMWVDEARSYNAASTICAAGAMCGHYTQVVWHSTRFVGCGMARCGDSEVWVCNYSPPGNYVGQRPY